MEEKQPFPKDPEQKTPSSLPKEKEEIREDLGKETCCGGMGEKQQKKEKEELSLLQEEVKEYKDKYLRSLAEMDNMRKRLQKEKQETLRFSIENVISEFLSPIDNLENALKFVQHTSQETKNWATGFQMILEQFKEVLHNNHITSFSSVGSYFDAHKHEAVEIQETKTEPEGIILEEFVKGYKSAERTIRPARVKVAKAPVKITSEAKVEDSSSVNKETLKKSPQTESHSSSNTEVDI